MSWLESFTFLNNLHYDFTVIVCLVPCIVFCASNKHTLQYEVFIEHCSTFCVQLCCAKASMARSLLHHSEPPLLCQDFTRSTINNQNIVCLKLFTKILYRLYSYDNSWTALSAFHGSRLNEQNSVQNKDWKFSSARANLENGYGVFLFV